MCADDHMNVGRLDVTVEPLGLLGATSVSHVAVLRGPVMAELTCSPEAVVTTPRQYTTLFSGKSRRGAMTRLEPAEATVVSVTKPVANELLVATCSVKRSGK